MSESSATSENGKKYGPAPRPEQEERAIIAAGTAIKGDIAGSQDILIQGSVEGTISLKENTVTIGSTATVAADISGRVIHVEGKVIGDLTAGEKVVVHSTGDIRGNITAPRLSLEDGARLKGAIDTDPDGAEKRLTQRVEKKGSGTKRAASTAPPSASDSASSPLNGEAAS